MPLNTDVCDSLSVNIELYVSAFTFVKCHTQLLMNVMKPTDEWGPASAINRTGKYARHVNIEKESPNDLKCIPNKTGIGNLDSETQGDTHQVHTSNHYDDVTPPPRYQHSVAADNEAFDDQENVTGSDSRDVIDVTSFRSDYRTASTKENAR